MCLLLHAFDAVSKGCRKLSVSTVDVDVVVLEISTFSEINLMSCGRPLVRDLTSGIYVPIHEVVASMYPRICATLLFPCIYRMRHCLCILW